LAPVVVFTIGKQGDTDILPAQMAEREKTVSTRKTLTEIVIKGLI
jgi:hypothetical protein